VKLIRPMLATLASEVPSGAQWTYEEKYDGIRALAHRQKGKVRLWSRNLLDLTAGFPEVAAAITALPGGDLVLDGELVVFDPKGVSRFQLLQRRGARRAPGVRGLRSPRTRWHAVDQTPVERAASAP